METIREAELTAQAAHRYPFIPVRMWAPAGRIAGLVREHLEIGLTRVLADHDFRFRGGFHHPVGARTRLTDPEPAATAGCV